MKDDSAAMKSLKNQLAEASSSLKVPRWTMSGRKVRF